LPMPRPQAAPPQQRPPQTTPPRPSSSPEEFEPPSLDSLMQAKIDPSTLSVRTLKAILKSNFVEHSKVLEKSELVTRVGRLLDDRRKEMQRTGDRDLEDEGLCRICCDASQNCVFLVSHVYYIWYSYDWLEINLYIFWRGWSRSVDIWSLVWIVAKRYAITVWNGTIELLF
jgi:hypothetical protein